MPCCLSAPQCSQQRTRVFRQHLHPHRAPSLTSCRPLPAASACRPRAPGVRPPACPSVGDGSLCPWRERRTHRQPQHRPRGRLTPRGVPLALLPPPLSPGHDKVTRAAGRPVRTGPEASTGRQIGCAFPPAVGTQDVRALCLENNPSLLEAEPHMQGESSLWTRAQKLVRRRWPHQSFLPAPSRPRWAQLDRHCMGFPQEPEGPTLAGPGGKSCPYTDTRQCPLPSNQEKGQRSLSISEARPTPTTGPSPGLLTQAHQLHLLVPKYPPHGSTVLVWTSTVHKLPRHVLPTRDNPSTPVLPDNSLDLAHPGEEGGGQPVLPAPWGSIPRAQGLLGLGVQTIPRWDEPATAHWGFPISDSENRRTRQTKPIPGLLCKAASIP